MPKKIFLFFWLVNIFSPVEGDQVIFNSESQNAENHSMKWAPFYGEEFIDGKFHFKYNQKLQKAYEDGKIFIKDNGAYREVLSSFSFPNLFYD